MRMPDAIAPYARLITVALLVLLVSASFVGGCSRGKAKQREADAKAMDAMRGQLRKASAALTASANALFEVDALTLAAQDAAEKQARLAAAAIVDARKDAAALRKQLDTITADIDRAKRDPHCKQQLEATSCAIFR